MPRPPRSRGLSLPSAWAISHDKQDPGGDLRVEGLRRGHRHLHVAAVGGVDDPVGALGRQVAVAAVDDGERWRLPRSRRRSTVRLVSVVEPDWLTAMTQGVLEGLGERRGRDLRGRARRHVDGLAEQAGGHPCDTRTRHGGGALAEQDHALDRAVPEPVADRPRAAPPRRSAAPEAGPGLDDAAPEGLAHRLGGLGDLLRQVVLARRRGRRPRW